MSKKKSQEVESKEETKEVRRYPFFGVIPIYGSDEGRVFAFCKAVINENGEVVSFEKGHNMTKAEAYDTYRKETGKYWDDINWGRIV